MTEQTGSLSSGVKYFMLISSLFVFTLIFMILSSNFTVHPKMMAVIQNRIPSLIASRFMNQSRPIQVKESKCQDCNIQVGNQSAFLDIFGDYTFPVPDCEGKLLVYECAGGLCGGLGDREKGIMSAFLLAILTSRTLVVDHRKPCDIKKFMLPNLYDWSKCLPHVGRERSKGNRLIHYIDGSGIQLPKDFSGQKEGDMWKEHVITIHINIRIQERLKGHPSAPQKLPWLMTSPAEKVITGLMHVLFKPETTLESHTRTFINEHTRQGKKKLVGVHVRTAFLKKSLDIPIVFQFLEQFSNKDNYSLYVAADDISIRNQALQKFQNVVSVNRTIVHIDQRNKPCEGVYTAVFEQQMLTKADILVMTPSGFSRLAAYIRGISDNIYLLQKKTKDSNATFEKIDLKELPIMFTHG